MQASAERDRVQPAQELTGVDQRIRRAYEFGDLSEYPFKKRFLIRAADFAFYLLISIIGRTVRFTVESREHWDSATKNGGLAIYTFWHDRIFLGTYFFRGRRIVVMTSRSFDGEYIARFIQRFGYGAARGSSSRGAVGAVVEMVRLMRAGCPTGFSIDGPRGPRHVAKIGAVLLAKKTGYPILPLAVNATRFSTVSSWDRFQIPWPFTRATVRFGVPIFVPEDADENLLEEKRQELQSVLDDLNT